MDADNAISAALEMQAALPEINKHLEEEIGDVMIYLSLLSSTIGVDPLDAALKKMEANERKYPATGKFQQFKK